VQTRPPSRPALEHANLQGGALTVQDHWFSAGRQIWLHRTKYTDGPPNYWYAFAGNPAATPIRSWDPVAPTATIEAPLPDAVDVVPWSAIVVRLSEPVTGIGAETVRLLDRSGEPVAAVVEHDPAVGTVSLRPEAPLALSARYTVSIDSGVADLAGNPLAPVAWSFSTRLDADPLSASLPVVLEAASHRLVRIGPDGSIAEEQQLDLVDERWVVARSRARLSG
jgi:hypothetical protein